MAAIFICYRREDSAGYAGRLFDHLENHFGKEIVFQDVENIPPGSNFEDFIRDKINECDVFLVVIARNFTTITNAAGGKKLYDPKDWVNIELHLARELKKKIIPILVDNAGMPKENEIPDSLNFLLTLNAYSIRHEKWKTDLKNLATVLERALSEADSEKKIQEKVHKAAELLKELLEQDIDSYHFDEIFRVIKNFNLTYSDFSNLEMYLSNFNNSRLDTCDFTGSDLEFSKFNMCNFRNGTFFDADFSGVDLSEIIFDESTRFPKILLRK